MAFYNNFDLVNSITYDDRSRVMMLSTEVLDGANTVITTLKNKGSTMPDYMSVLGENISFQIDDPRLPSDIVGALDKSFARITCQLYEFNQLAKQVSVGNNSKMFNAVKKLVDIWDWGPNKPQILTDLEGTNYMVFDR